VVALFMDFSSEILYVPSPHFFNQYILAETLLISVRGGGKIAWNWIRKEHRCGEGLRMFAGSQERGLELGAL